MTHDDNPHTENLPHATVVYWSVGRACGKHDAWTEAIVSATGSFPRMTFHARSGDHADMQGVLRLMEEAFQRGKKERSREIAALLNDGGAN